MDLTQISIPKDRDRENKCRKISKSAENPWFCVNFFQRFEKKIEFIENFQKTDQKEL